MAKLYYFSTEVFNALFSALDLILKNEILLRSQHRKHTKEALVFVDLGVHGVFCRPDH